MEANQRDLVQQLVEQGIVRPNFIVAELMEHGPNDGLVWKVLFLAPKLDQSDFDLAASPTSATYVEPLHGNKQVGQQCLAIAGLTGLTVPVIYRITPEESAPNSV